MNLPPGALLDERYIVEATLGRGGFATVYAARHAVLGTEHAVKVLDASQDRDSRGRLLREGRIQARLAHPNVVRVTDVVELNDGVALVMDRVHGETLRHLLDRGPPALPLALALAQGILDGVAAAHAAGLVHRDLKPENVLIGADGAPRVTDFGIAHSLDVTLDGAQTITGIGMGTPGYMAPEAYVDVASVDARADVFALGAIFYELLSGQRAFPRQGSWREHYQRASRGEVVPLQQAAPALPAHLVNAVHGALAPLRSARPASVAALGALWRGATPPPNLGSAGATINIDASIFNPTQQQSGMLGQGHNLPAERDSFVGRKAELAALDQRFADGARLLTVSGIGGAGKTRIIVHYGWTRRAMWPGGVWFCDLTEARTADGIAGAVATALDVPLGATPVAQLGHAIAGRGRALIILDNFEQVAHFAAETLGCWLDRASEAVFVVTTREVLRLPGEEVLPLEPLSEAAGVALFVARAAAIRVDVGEDDRAALGELVRLLDGLPLAIELAAARARVLTAGQILARMGERFKLLRSSGGRANRHASLRGMLDWSWELLKPPERLGLAQLSVFAGGFSLGAAEAVLDDSEAWPVEVVQALVEASLVRRVSKDRFNLLVSVAEYAAERLDQLGHRASTEARHGACFAEMGAVAALDALEVHGGHRQRRAMALDLDNLLSASQRGITRGDAPVAAGAALAAWEVLGLMGPVPIGVALLERVATLEGLSDTTRARVLIGAGHARRLNGQREQGRVHVEGAIALARAAGDRRREGVALRLRGFIHMLQSRREEAEADYQLSLSLIRAVGSRADQGVMLTSLGVLYNVWQRNDEARVFLEEAIAISREVGNVRFVGVGSGALGIVHYQQGRLEEARACYESAILIHREVGDRRTEGVAVGNLGILEACVGRLDLALARSEEALRIHRDVGDRASEGVDLCNIGRNYFIGGAMDLATSHFNAALAIAREVGDRLFEGALLGYLGLLHLRQGDLELARRNLAAGEVLLRAHDHLVELGKLLCARAELEWASGEPEAALRSLAEATGIASRAGAGPASELGQRVADLRVALGVELDPI